MQINYDEDHVLPQITCICSTQNFVSMKIDCVKNQSILVMFFFFRFGGISFINAFDYLIIKTN